MDNRADERLNTINQLRMIADDLEKGCLPICQELQNILVNTKNW